MVGFLLAENPEGLLRSMRCMRGRYGGVEYDSGQSISRQQLTDNFLAPFL